MINPNDITNYHRTEGELQEFLLFCVMCAGKSSTVQAQKLQEFLDLVESNDGSRYRIKDVIETPFQNIRNLKCEQSLLWCMKRTKVGKYKLLSDCIRLMCLARQLPPLKTWNKSPHEKRNKLIEFPGIGIKTASLFLLHSERDSRMAVLDTHLLKHLRKLYPKARVPKASPQSMDRYMELEDMWLGYCYRNGYDPATHDLDIWKEKAA